MWGGVMWGGSTWAGHPAYGVSVPGIVCGGDETVMYAYGEDVSGPGSVSGGVMSEGGKVCGGDSGDRAKGYASGQDYAAGRVVGGDENAG